MQQYFCDEPLIVGEEYKLNSKQAHHAKVVRLNNETVRLVYDNIGYFGTIHWDGNECYVHIDAKDDCINEMNVDVTLLMGLIRKEKFELVIQKAVELGVKRIVPLVTSRCVVQIKKDKESKQLERWNDISKEASEQCKRNVIPSVEKAIKFKDIAQYKSELNVAPYENSYGQDKYISDVYSSQKSVTVVIGPEGGFSEEEVNYLKDNGFLPVTLGSRIYRAETAAMYSVAILNEISREVE